MGWVSGGGRFGGEGELIVFVAAQVVCGMFGVDEVVWMGGRDYARDNAEDVFQIESSQ